VLLMALTVARARITISLHLHLHLLVQLHVLVGAILSNLPAVSSDFPDRAVAGTGRS
jgi:hypothetical protein